METLQPKYRRPRGGWRLASIGLPALVLVAVLLYVFNLRPFGFVLVDLEYLYVLLAALLPLCFLWIPATAGAPRDRVPWYDVLLIVASLVIPSYFAANIRPIMLQGWAVGAPPLATAASTILWGLSIESGRRAAGPIFAGVVAFFSIYPLFASVMPGVLMGKTLSFSRTAAFHALSEDSIVGLPLHVFGELFLGYMFFAIVVQVLGAGQFFGDIAQALVGKTRAGNAKVAIIASGLFGTISGAPIANVMTTGCFTIPAMKRDGLSSEFAGGVEAVASSGGALMPPVMGAVAFIMAQFMAVPYAEVALAAAVPAILLYWCLFVQIDSYAARIGLKPSVITVKAPPIWRSMLKYSHIWISALALVVILFWLQLERWAPWIAGGIAILLGMVRKETRLSPRRSVGLLEELGRGLGELTGIMGPVGMIIGSFVVIGIAYTFPRAVVGLAGGNVWLLLIFGAVASFILGMGVTVSACYIFLAIVLVPGLVEFGLDRMAANLYVLYWGIISYITPPVALAAFAAASISGGDPMKTGFQAMKLGGAIYILPFVFVLSPALILRGPISEIPLVVTTAAIGLALIGAALEGYFWRLGNLTPLMRVLLLGAGALLVTPGLITDLYGLGAFAALFALAYVLRQTENPLARLLLQPRTSGKAAK